MSEKMFDLEQKPLESKMLHDCVCASVSCSCVRNACVAIGDVSFLFAFNNDLSFCLRMSKICLLLLVCLAKF